MRRRKSGRRPYAERFWQRTRRESSGCWTWTGSVNNTATGPIGTFPVEGNSYTRRSVNRIAWELSYGPVPRGMVVAHTCGNVLCVNPEHLELRRPGHPSRKK